MALKNAADALQGSTAAIHLRYLQTLCRISTNKNHTIVVPIPMEIVRKFFKKIKRIKN